MLILHNSWINFTPNTFSEHHLINYRTEEKWSKSLTWYNSLMIQCNICPSPWLSVFCTLHHRKANISHCSVIYFHNPPLRHVPFAPFHQSTKNTHITFFIVFYVHLFRAKYLISTNEILKILFGRIFSSKHEKLQLYNL